MRNSLIVTALLLSSTVTLAQESKCKGRVRCSEKILDFADWKSKYASEAAVLNLYPDFSEPTIEVNANGVVKQKHLKMTMYVVTATAELNKSAANIKLPTLISEQLFQKLDPEAKIKRISAAQAMTNVVGKSAISNFQWCNANPSDPEIRLPQLERSQAHMVRPGRPWCANDDRTSCFETCRLLPKLSAMEVAIAGYNIGARMAGKNGKDFGIATQVEARYYASEAEFGAKVPLSSLTKLNTPIGGILEINFFYFNQVMLYAKQVIVLQSSPKDTQKTIMTNISAFGVRSDAWNHSVGGGRVQAILKSSSNMNTGTGILAGIPSFTNSTMNVLAEALEK